MKTLWYSQSELHTLKNNLKINTSSIAYLKLYEISKRRDLKNAYKALIDAENKCLRISFKMFCSNVLFNCNRRLNFCVFLQKTALNIKTITSVDSNKMKTVKLINMPSETLQLFHANKNYFFNILFKSFSEIEILFLWKILKNLKKITTNDFFACGVNRKII